MLEIPGLVPCRAERALDFARSAALPSPRAVPRPVGLDDDRLAKLKIGDGESAIRASHCRDREREILAFVQPARAPQLREAQPYAVLLPPRDRAGKDNRFVGFGCAPLRRRLGFTRTERGRYDAGTDRS